jgi:hypothetical protein
MSSLCTVVGIRIAGHLVLAVASITPPRGRELGHNGSVYMSVETITMLGSPVSILLALAGGFGWMIHRMDSRIDSVESRLGARIDSVDVRIDGLGARLDRVADELVEVKIAVARIEGTPRHLITGR